LATQDPYSSEVAYRLISALEATGDRAGAITQAHIHTETVRSDLEVEPDNTVLELVDLLRKQPSQSVSLAVSEPSFTVNGTVGATADESRHSPGGGTLSLLRLRNVLGAILVLLVCAGALLGLRGNGTSLAAPTVSLAVLPFENLGSPNDDYFVIGLAEDIVCRLAGMQRLSLVGPNDGGLDTPDDAEVFTDAGLDAEFLLRGSVERVLSADGSLSVRVIPSLTRVADGAQIWTETIREDLAQVFAGQIRVVEAVVQVLGLSPLSTERDWLRTTPTSDPEAYDLFLLGNDNLRRASYDVDAARTAVELFERATARDSGFVRAFAKLAIAHTSMYWWNHDRTPHRLAAAKAAADQAVQLRPDIPDCHLALGWYYYWGERDYDRALRHFELARTNWPGVSDVLALVAGIRRRQGDFEQALENHYEAAEIDPSCATCKAGASFTHLILREFSTAEDDALAALSIAPDFSYARNVAAMARLGERGDTAGARDILADPTNGEQVLRLSAGHWSAIPRVLGGEYDSVISRMRLSSSLQDSAGYYLAKADVATRVEQPTIAIAHFDSARTILERQVAALPDDPRIHSRLGLAYAGLGLRLQAVQEGTEATRLRPVTEDAVDGPLAVETLARIYTILGDVETAIDRLEMLLSIPSHVSAQSIRLDPAWAPLRQHERFQRLVR
jgi:serine/threonine-protein kinase